MHMSYAPHMSVQSPLQRPRTDAFIWFSFVHLYDVSAKCHPISAIQIWTKTSAYMIKPFIQPIRGSVQPINSMYIWLRHQIPCFLVLCGTCWAANNVGWHFCNTYINCLFLFNDFSVSNDSSSINVAPQWSNEPYVSIPSVSFIIRWLSMLLLGAVIASIIRYRGIYNIIIKYTKQNLWKIKETVSDDWTNLLPKKKRRNTFIHFKLNVA